MSMCLVLNAYRDAAIRNSRPNCVRFLFVGLGEWRSSQKKVDTRDEFLDRILDAAASNKQREDQLVSTTCDLHTRVPNCMEVDGGILEQL